MRMQSFDPAAFVIGGGLDEEQTDFVNEAMSSLPFEISSGSLLPTSDTLHLWVSNSVVWPEGTKQIETSGDRLAISPPAACVEP